MRAFRTARLFVVGPVPGAEGRRRGRALPIEYVIGFERGFDSLRRLGRRRRVFRRLFKRSVGVAGIAVAWRALAGEKTSLQLRGLLLCSLRGGRHRSSQW